MDDSLEIEHSVKASAVRGAVEERPVEGRAGRGEVASPDRAIRTASGESLPRDAASPAEAALRSATARGAKSPSQHQ
jgi:hypothetical protein